MSETISPSEAEVRKTNTAPEKLTEQRQALSKEDIEELDRADQEASQQSLALVREKLRVLRGRLREEEEIKHINSLESEYQPSLTGYKLRAKFGLGKEPPVDSGYWGTYTTGLIHPDRREAVRRLQKFIGLPDRIGGEQRQYPLTEVAKAEVQIVQPVQAPIGSMAA